MRKYEGFEDLLRDFETKDPEAAAVVTAAHGQRSVISRKEFARMARERAGQLAEEESTCLGVLCDGSPECVLTIFGSVLSGKQTVLLNENVPDRTLKEQITHTDIDALWGDPDLADELAPCLTKGLASAQEQEEGRRRILFFTSGTTAGSKAVVLTDESLMAAAWNGSCMLPLQKEDVLMCMLPLDHVFGMVCSLLWGMQCGAAAALGRGMRYYTQDLEFFAPTVLSAVPSLLEFLLSQNLINRELRLVLVGAGDCPRPVLEKAAAQGLSISFGYGLTETSSGVAISCGGDPYALDVCPEDTVTLAADGEILVSSESCMMQGYYRQPQETESVLKDGVLYTGDLGKWDREGRLHIIGRKKEILVLRDGTKIFLPEYEERLKKVLPGKDFAVLAKEGRPVLMVCTKKGEKDRIREAIRPVMNTLPRSQQISGIITTSDALPRTASGKLMRWALQQRL